MAGKRDIIWVADKMVAVLQTSLPAKLDSLETEYNDGIVLVDVPSARMFVAEKQRLPAVPFIVVVPDRTDTVPMSGESRYGIEFHQLTAAVMDGGNLDEDRLKRRCGRYVRAVEEVFLDNRTLGASVEDVMVMGKDYAPMMAGSSGLVQEGQLTLRVETMT